MASIRRRGASRGARCGGRKFWRCVAAARRERLRGRVAVRRVVRRREVLAAIASVGAGSLAADRAVSRLRPLSGVTRHQGLSRRQWLQLILSGRADRAGAGTRREIVALHEFVLAHRDPIRGIRGRALVVMLQRAGRMPALQRLGRRTGNLACSVLFVTWLTPCADKIHFANGAKCERDVCATKTKYV